MPSAIYYVSRFSGRKPSTKPRELTEKQLEESADLANVITTKKNIPVIISVGLGATILNSLDVGMILCRRITKAECIFASTSSLSH